MNRFNIWGQAAKPAKIASRRHSLSSAGRTTMIMLPKSVTITDDTMRVKDVAT